MKKLMLVALALIGLVAADASATFGYRGYRGYGYGYAGGYGDCNRCRPCPKVCGPVCPKPCIRTIEEEKPADKCCVRYVRVEEPCLWTKHVSWSCECPTTCQEEFGHKNYDVEIVGQTGY